MRIAFGEQRPDGPVDQAAGENFLLGGPAFALDEAAGKTPGGVSVLAVIHGEGEKIGAGLGLGRGTGGHQDHRFAGADNHRSIGLFGHLPGFDRDDPATAEIHFNGMQHV